MNGIYYDKEPVLRVILDREKRIKSLNSLNEENMRMGFNLPTVLILCNGNKIFIESLDHTQVFLNVIFVLANRASHCNQLKKFEDELLLNLVFTL